jgi:hypothetical protein
MINKIKIMYFRYTLKFDYKLDLSNIITLIINYWLVGVCENLCLLKFRLFLLINIFENKD